MSRVTGFFLVAIAWLLAGCTFNFVKPRTETTHDEHIDFQELVHRYMNKTSTDPIEGIYTVSGLVTRTKKGLLSSEEKERVTDRRDNYAQVAIIRDTRNAERAYIEVSLNAEGLVRYPVIGEFSKTATGSLLMYRHIDAKGKVTVYTFTPDETGSTLDGIRVETEGNSTVTYKLVYVKTAPSH